MKKTFLSKPLLSILVLAALFVSSCKKDNNSPNGYYVKFKLDGNEKQYSQTTAAVFATALPIYSLALIGEQQVNGTVYEGMGINIYNDASIAANVTYTDQEVVSLGTPQAALLYTDAAGAQSSSVVLASPGVQVLITGLDDKTVSGTFSGTIASITDFSKTMVVTEGQFNLPRQ